MASSEGVFQMELQIKNYHTIPSQVFSFEDKCDIMPAK
jgi:hypothetical protein